MFQAIAAPTRSCHSPVQLSNRCFALFARRFSRETMTAARAAICSNFPGVDGSRRFYLQPVRAVHRRAVAPPAEDIDRADFKLDQRTRADWLSNACTPGVLAVTADTRGSCLYYSTRDTPPPLSHVFCLLDSRFRLALFSFPLPLTFPFARCFLLLSRQRTERERGAR